jgi:hypothetical protein
MIVTAGQLVSAIQALAQAGVDVSAAASLNLSNLPADEAVADDVLTVVAVFWPPAYLLEMALPIALAIAQLAIDNPGSGANRDPLGSRGGRRP